MYMVGLLGGFLGVYVISERRASTDSQRIVALEEDQRVGAIRMDRMSEKHAETHLQLAVLSNEVGGLKTTVTHGFSSVMRRLDNLSNALNVARRRDDVNATLILPVSEDDQ